MRPARWQVAKAMDPQNHPSIRSGCTPDRLSELLAHTEQLMQRLQHFQQCYGTQLNRVDQRWLYHAQQQLAFYCAEIAQLDALHGVAPGALEAIKEGEVIEPPVRNVGRIASATPQSTEIRPQRRETRRRRRAASGIIDSSVHTL